MATALVIESSRLGVPADLPGNTLTYALGAGAPSGMSVDSAMAVLRWLAHQVSSPTTNQFVVTVLDNGSPPLFDTRTLVVVVSPAQQPTIAAALAGTGLLRISVTNLAAGRTHFVQRSSDFIDPRRL